MKIVKRILWVVLSLGIGFAVFLVGSVAFDIAVDGERINALTNTTIPGQDGGPEVRTYVAALEPRFKPYFVYLF